MSTDSGTQAAEAARTSMPPPVVDQRLLELESKRLEIQKEELGVRRLEAEAKKMEAQAQLRHAMGVLTDEERGLERQRVRLELARGEFKQKHELADLVAHSGFVRESIKDGERYAFAFGLVELAPLLGVSPFVMAQNAYSVHGTIGFEVDYMAALVEQRAALDERFTFEFGTADPKKHQGLPEYVIARCKLQGEKLHREYKFTAEMVLSASWSKEKNGDLKGTYRAEGANQMRRRALSRLISATPALKGVILGIITWEAEDEEGALKVQVQQGGRKGPALPPAPPTLALPGGDLDLDELRALERSATASQREAVCFVVGVDERVPFASLPAAQQAQLLVELRKLGVQRPQVVEAEPVTPQAPAQPAAATAEEAAPPKFPTAEELQALERALGAEFTAAARRKLNLSANANLSRLTDADRLAYGRALEANLPPDERRW